MSEEMGGRRERRKAQTRAEIRATAQQLFAERGFEAVTTADVAAAADVAVQTVFNHFETKEALFFDDRTPWAHRPLTALTDRPAGSDPVATLRRVTEAELAELMDRESRPEGHDYLEALARSAALRSRERTLVEEAAEEVAGALAAAITAGDWPAAPAADPTTAQLLSRLIASLFYSGSRALVLENRRLVLAPEGSQPGLRDREGTIRATLTELERCVTGLARQPLGRETS